MESALTNATSQTNFGTIDWVIVAVYLLLSVGIAFFVKRYAGNMTNFVSAGRAVGTWLGVATLTGTEMGLITVMYSAQKGFTAGFAAFHIGVIAGVVALIIGLTGFLQSPSIMRNVSAAALVSSAASCWRLAAC
jgi:SSS family solute:Na+ symporter